MVPFRAFADAGTEKVLEACYEKHPFLLDAIAQISDEDFKNRERSQNRKREIAALYVKQGESIEKCVFKIIDAAKESGEEDTLKHTEWRMGEVLFVILDGDKDHSRESVQ